VFHRHDLITADPEAWGSALARLREPDSTGLLADWARRGRPAIIRRRFADEPADLLPLGVQLPLAAGRRRVALLLPPDAVLARPARPESAGAIPHAPPGWHPALHALQALPGLAAPPRVFGSLLWQCMTGLAYLRPDSDLDLTFPCAGDPGAVAAAIGVIDGRGEPRIDGELILPDGAACHWREVLEGRSPEVLVKTAQGVALRPRSALAGA